MNLLIPIKPLLAGDTTITKKTLVDNNCVTFDGRLTVDIKIFSLEESPSKLVPIISQFLTDCGVVKKETQIVPRVQYVAETDAQPYITVSWVTSRDLNKVPAGLTPDMLPY